MDQSYSNSYSFFFTMRSLLPVLKEIYHAIFVCCIVSFFLEAVFPGYISMVIPLDFFVWVGILSAVIYTGFVRFLNNDSVQS